MHTRATPPGYFLAPSGESPAATSLQRIGLAAGAGKEEKEDPAGRGHLLPSSVVSVVILIFIVVVIIPADGVACAEIDDLRADDILEFILTELVIVAL